MARRSLLAGLVALPVATVPALAVQGADPGLLALVQECERIHQESNAVDFEDPDFDALCRASAAARARVVAFPVRSYGDVLLKVRAFRCIYRTEAEVQEELQSQLSDGWCTDDTMALGIVRDLMILGGEA